MATLFKFISAFFILTITSCQSNNGGKATYNQAEIFLVDENIISKFQWPQLADTTKLKVCYLQINFLNFPDDNYTGKNILDFKDSISTTSLILTNQQRLELFKLVTDTSNYSEGDCGTFHLNAGFILFDNRKICSTIDIGCAFNQWNFTPEIPNSKHTSFNEKGLQEYGKAFGRHKFKQSKMAEHKINFTEHDYDKWLQPTASLAIPRTDETCALIGSAWPVGSPNVRTRLDKQQSAFGYVVRHVYFYGQKVGPGR